MDYVKKYGMISAHDMIVAGVSGGADSVCLLFVLLEMKKRIPFTVKVVHVNHGIREDADRDEEFVKEICEKFHLPFYLVRVDIKELAARSGRSEEEEGRWVRYQAFRDVLGDVPGKIAVAHNSNDRAETMLFHLFRGTGLGGALGIRPVNGSIIRPLLGVTREEIEKWLSQRNISYCIDSTNAQDLYTRNKIRHHILPYAEQEICKGAVMNMSRAAEGLLMAEEYLKKETEKAVGRCVRFDEAGGFAVIGLSAFEREDEYLRGRILLSCIEKAAGSRKDIGAAHIQSIEKLFQSSGSKEIHLPYQLTVYKKYDLGIIRKECAGKQDSRQDHDRKGKERDIREAVVPGQVMVPNLGIVEFTVFSAYKSQNIPEKTYTKWFDYDKIASTMVFRARRPGDYLTVKNASGGQCHKLLQDFFVNAKIPRDQRDEIYVLAEGSHIIWIPGHRISEYYKVSENTCNILQVGILSQD